MKNAWIPGALCVVALIFFSRLSAHFLDWHFLITNSSTFAELGLLAIGSTFVIVSGQIDLSVASLMALDACLTAKLMHGGASLPVAILFSIFLGIALGLFNGILVAKLKLPSFLVTLGTLAAYRGLAQAILGPDSVQIPQKFIGLDQIGVGGIPDPVILFIIFAILGGLLLHQTAFGRWVFATGSNESAARYSGISVDKVKIAVFAISGFLAGVGALLLVSRLGVARYDLANGQELDAITIVVVGGTSILGGRGSMLGTALALCLIDIIETGMGVADVKLEYRLTIIGILLILSVLTMNSADLVKALKLNRKKKPIQEAQS